jgi:hypothetical protein
MFYQIVDLCPLGDPWDMSVLLLSPKEALTLIWVQAHTDSMSLGLAGIDSGSENTCDFLLWEEAWAHFTTSAVKLLLFCRL